jgi:hypothetical protein
MSETLIPISDFHKLAVLDLLKVVPTKTEHTGRFWAYYPQEKVEVILTEYETGTLKVIARDFVASVQRIKDRIFEAERARARSGDHNATSHH